MEKQLLSLGLLSLLSLNNFAQTTQTVSVGAGYADQKWYSLENGVVATQSKDNWDIAFEMTGFSSAIFANTQKSNFAIYHAPFKIANYGTLDTVGISNWDMLFNSDTTWTIGAFNRGADPNNANDLGWGVYDSNTHFVTGDSCFVIKLSATSYKKLKIVSLVSGVYNFEYADINGANSFTQTIAKSAFAGKNFAYFDFTTNSAIDREPVSSSWDLTFGKYTAILMAPSPTPYGVTGIMSNKGVYIAQANNVSAPLTYTNWTSHTLNTNITTMGHDWKTFDLSNNVWKIVGDTVYFIKDRGHNIWKVRFNAFGGSTTGDVVFTKEKIAANAVGIDSKGNVISQVAVYPNPSNSNDASLLFSSEIPLSNVSVSIMDLTGKIVSEEMINVENGLNTYKLRTNELNSGVYFVRVNSGSHSTTQKLIIQ